MKWLKFLVAGFGLLSIANNLWAANQPEGLFVPFLDPASQSNLTVHVSQFAKEEPCPMQFTNVISNTNLFTPEEQKMFAETLVKYKGVTINSGPPGSVFVNSYKTNIVVPPLYWMDTNAAWNVRRTNEVLVSVFKYTNSEAHEEIRFNSGIFAKFRNKSNDGYNASIVRTGGGSLLNVTEIKHGSPIGLLMRFSDLHPQGNSWNYRLADFSDGHLGEYMQMTNGMVFGKWLMWNVRSGGLTLSADAKQPYDWNNHRIKLP